MFPVAATLLLWRLGLALLDPRAALLAAGLFALAAADPSVQGMILNAETIMVVPAILSARLWWRTRRAGSPAAAAGGGVWLAVAALVKQPAALQAVLLFALRDARGRRLRPVLAALAGTAGGAALAAGGLAAAGVLPSLAESLREGGRYVAAEGAGWWRGYPPAFAGILRTQGAVWWLALIGVTAGRWTPGARGFTALWLLGSSGGVLLGRRAFPHYFIQLLPAVCLAAGAGLGWLLRPRPGRFGLALRVVTAGFAAAGALTLRPLLAAPRDVRAGLLFPDNHFVAVERAADWLRAQAPREGRIFVAGAEPGIPLRAGLQPAGRYPFVYHLTREAPETAARQAAWLAELDAPETGAVVVSAAPTSWHDLDTSPRQVARLQAAVRARLAAASWRLAAVIPPFSIYLRRP